MSPNINIICLIGSMTLFMLPVTVYGQEHDSERKASREDVLRMDIDSLGERAVNDMVISEKERQRIDLYVRDSLPGDSELKIQALQQIRDDLDSQYEEMVRNSLELLDDLGYIGSRMLPDRLYIPDDYVSPEELQRKREIAAVGKAGIDKDKLMKHVKPLKMKPWLLGALRMLFGRGVSQRPERWDYSVVPQMGGVYDIIVPGGRPDDSWRDAPKMFYDPNPDKHFRR